MLERERSNPPTTMVDKLTINLCKPVGVPSEGAERDKARQNLLFTTTSFYHMKTDLATAPLS